MAEMNSSAPLELTNAELDVNNNNIAVPVNAAVAANVLGGGAIAGAAQRPGNQTQ